MSEQELNSYRFTSGSEPSDEMLECIMKEVTKDVIMRRCEAEKRLNESISNQRIALKAEWSKRLSNIL